MRAMWLLVSLIALPAKASAEPVCAPRTDDAVAIERTIHAFYDALGRDDRTAFKRQLTPDFIGFEFAEQFNADQLFELVAKAHRDGVTILWNVGSLTTKVDCQTAWAHWENRGSSGKPGQLVPRRWRESAVLRRHGNGWRIELFHSTSASK